MALKAREHKRRRNKLLKLNYKRSKKGATTKNAKNPQILITI
jgi:hypothetical protein